jgi:transposase
MLPSRARIFVCTVAVDMRRAFDGLAATTRDVLREDPEGGALFVFSNRRRDRVKILWWDCTGYCLLYKRLERGAFRIPDALEPGEDKVAIDLRELAKILEGISLPPTRRAA